MTVEELKAKQDHLRTIKVARDSAQKRFKALDADWHREMNEVREIMEEVGIKTMRTELGGYEAPEPTWYATVQDWNAFADWARENQPGLLRYDHGVSAEMNALVRERIDDKQPPPPGLGAYPKKVVRCTK